MRPFQHQLPSKGNYLDLTLADMKDITQQLGQLLRVESDLLGEMRVKEIGPMQAQKQKLSQKLESFQKLLAADDTIVKTAAAQDREELLMLTDDLAAAIEENMRRTVVAQNVNQRVMRSLMDVMAEQQCTGAYGRLGQANATPAPAISLNLNERA